MKNRSLSLIFFFFFFFSCVQEDILYFKAEEPRLVINALFSPQEELAIHLSRSFGSKGELSEAVLEKPATVRVYVNGHFEGLMSPNDPVLTEEEASLYLKGRYCLSGFKPAVGDEIRIEAEYGDLPVALATTRIPDKPTLLGVDTVRYWDKTSSEAMRLYVRLKDNGSSLNYYRLLTSLNITGDGAPEGEYYPILNGEYYIYPSSSSWYITFDDPAFTAEQPIHAGTSQRTGNGVFTNILFRGNEYVLKYALTNLINSLKTDSIDWRVHYQVKLLGISESYYNYYKQNAGVSLSVGPIQVIQPGENYRLYSNVENGLGLVASCHEATYTINMPYDADE